jgi:predicted ATPase
MKNGLNTITYTNPSNQTDLLTTHSNKVSFSNDKINVLIGPNGSGKSTVIRHLAVRYLCLDRGYTSLDRGISERAYGSYFTEERWRKATFMPGIDVDTANCIALYWAPGMKYGGWEMDTAAMMSGYSDEAKLRWEHTRKKSSGQGIQNQLEHHMEVIEGKRKLEFKQKLDYYITQYHDEKLKAITPLFNDWEKTKTIVLLDEPEQSLDMSKEIDFWDRLLNVDTGEIQMVIATHSLYPLISPKFKDKFNYIETVAGYKQSIVDQWNNVKVS